MRESAVREITQLNRQFIQLYRQGRYTEAMNIANQVLELARRYFGEEHTEFASSLVNLAAIHQALGNYNEAEPLLKQALEIRKRVLSSDHLAVGTTLNNLAGLFEAKGDYRSAEPLYAQALEIYRKTKGEADPEYATVLSNLAQLYSATGRYVQAEPLLKQVLEIRRRSLGAEHADVALSRNNLAALYKELGKYAEAESLYREAIDIYHQQYGDEHPNLAVALNNLAELLEATGNYVEAVEHLRQASLIWRKTLGDSHPYYATSLNNLAGLYEATGDYKAAIPLYDEALTIRRRLFGEGHLEVALVLNNLAQLYFAMGNYSHAEPLFKQALEIYRSQRGEEHPDVVVVSSNLASLYQATGNYVSAERLFREALESRRKLFGDSHPAYATSLNNLASLYIEMNRYTEAEPLLAQALAIRRTVLGELHPDVASVLNNMAALYNRTQRYEKAEEFYRMAADNRRRAARDKQPEYAGSLVNLAGVYLLKGDYAKAEERVKEALDIWRSVIGEEHPYYVNGLINLASVYAATDRAMQALELMKQAVAISDKLISQVFSIGSESQRMAFLKILDSELNGFISLVFQYLANSRSAVQAAFDQVLRRKALGAEAISEQREAVLRGRYPHLEPKLRRIATLRSQIARTLLARTDRADSEARRDQIAEWMREKEEIEADLAHQIPEMSLQERLKRVSCSLIASILPEDSAIVEFVRLNVFDFQAVAARGEPLWRPARYLAFVLLSGQPDQVEMIDLTEAGPIDLMVAIYRSLITGERIRQDVRHLLPVGEVSSQFTISQAGTVLREMIFDPLKDALGHTKRLFLCPDGDLTRVPFEALHKDDSHLIDEFHITYLSAGRDFLRFALTTTREPTAPLVAADPDFNLGMPSEIPTSNVADVVTRHSRDLSDANQHFTRLPGTHQEGEHVAALLKVEPLLDKDVLESRIKACRSPHILHIATHGFFLPDQKRDSSKNQLGGVPWDSFVDSNLSHLAELENPLLRSGLALAGANTWLEGKPLPPEAEDGILTAEDITSMDLLDTDLVVLSACETGLGEVHVGEGVFGLRRAFVLAGVKALVMSLWKVPDRHTQELMEEFYRQLLAGEAIADALREAKLTLREKYPNLLDWAAFICQGNPRVQIIRPQG